VVGKWILGFEKEQKKWGIFRLKVTKLTKAAVPFTSFIYNKIMAGSELQQGNSTIDQADLG
jgi:hypothetical protein